MNSKGLVGCDGLANSLDSILGEENWTAGRPSERQLSPGKFEKTYELRHRNGYAEGKSIGTLSVVVYEIRHKGRRFQSITFEGRPNAIPGYNEGFTARAVENPAGIGYKGNSNNTGLQPMLRKDRYNIGLCSDEVPSMTRLIHQADPDFLSEN